MSTRKLGDTHTFRFITSDPTTSAVTDADSTPVLNVYEESTDVAILTPTVTNVTTGHYRSDIAITAGNGFEAGKQYSAVVTATVGSVAGAGIVGVFKVETNELDDLSTFDNSTDGVNVIQISGDSTAANNLELDYDGTGYNRANSTIGTVTDVTNGVTASTVSDKTGYTLSAAGIDSVWDEVMDSTHTARQLMKLVRAVLGGLSTGGGTTTVNFKREDDTTNAVTATVDSNGNRSAVTLNL